MSSPGAGPTFNEYRTKTNKGEKFTARRVRGWLAKLQIKPLFIEPGSPWENGYFESFNGKMRDELLNGEIFYTLKEAKVLIEMWRKEYNTIRRHSALGYQPPVPEVIMVPTTQFQQFMLPGFNYEVQLWIRTQDPDVLRWNPITGTLESQTERIVAACECEYVLPDVRVPSIPFWSRKMNSKVWESLTVYVSFGGLNLSASEAG